MKTIFLLLLSLVSYKAIASQTITENQKLESLAKVWGFLKYYHPEVAKGKIDWDAELIRKISEVKKARDQRELNEIYSTWLNQLGKVKPCRSCDNNVPDSLMRNATFNWLYDTNTFTPELTLKLEYIRQNRNQGKNFYVQPRYPLLKVQAYFKNEKAYKDLEAYPAEEYRLLGLFRYWNIINYFFPYKYAIGENWDSVLADMIPKFRNAPNTGEYHLAMKELTVRINDGHSFFHTRLIGQYHGAFYTPFQVKMIDGKAIVSGFYHEGFAKADSINLGDVITRINGLPIAEVLEPRLKYTAGSNQSYKLSKAADILLNGNTATLNITIQKDGKEQELNIRRYPFSRFGAHLKQQEEQQPWRMLGNQVGYINMGSLEKKDVKTAMKELNPAKGIIIDLREYPKPGTPGAVANYILADKFHTAVFTYPDLSYPGVFRHKHGPLKYGSKNNPNRYKGKVVLLVNEGTMSTGEFTTMALQLAPDVITIGSQTAGADGNIVDIVFPGGFIANMSGLGVYYPDGRATQRIGIVPDIEIKPTIEGIRKGEDEVLEKAVNYIRSDK